MRIPDSTLLTYLDNPHKTPECKEILIKVFQIGLLSEQLTLDEVSTLHKDMRKLEKGVTQSKIDASLGKVFPDRQVNDSLDF
jgi:hypothetical protein